MLTSEYKHKGYNPAPTLGFQALGAAAKPAVPVLVAMLDDKRLTIAATTALGAIGPAAEEAVLPLLRRSSPADGPPAILRVEALAKIKMRSELVVPIFMDILATNRDLGCMACLYIEALGSFGGQAKPAVPVLKLFLDSTEESVRVCTTNSLKKIDPDAVFKGRIK
jgi:HEAT repeat protein